MVICYSFNRKLIHFPKQEEENGAKMPRQERKEMRLGVQGSSPSCHPTPFSHTDLNRNLQSVIKTSIPRPPMEREGGS